MANTRLEYLFMRHYEKKATAEEKGELMALIQDENNTGQLNSLVEAVLKNPMPGFGLEEDKANIILHHILQEDTGIPVTFRRSGRKWYYAAAAVVIGMISIAGIYKYRLFAPAIAPLVHTVMPVKQEVMPGGNKATLTLGDGSTIALDDAHNGTLAQQGAVKIVKKDNGQLAYQSLKDPRTVNIMQYNTITTPRGGQYQVVLPDGTKAWLNASSSLKYPTAFTGDTRDVVLTGEAYFEVAKNADKPFHVAVGGMEVEVLGTHFNIMAYPDEKAIKTTLLEGAVKVAKGNASATLAPGEQASIISSDTRFTKKQVNVEEDVAWKEGFIQFSNATLPAIMRQVSRWYDVEVSYEKTIPHKEFKGKVPRTVPLSELLNMLQYTGLQCKIDHGKIIVLN